VVAVGLAIADVMAVRAYDSLGRLVSRQAPYSGGDRRMAYGDVLLRWCASDCRALEGPDHRPPGLPLLPRGHHRSRPLGSATGLFRRHSALSL